MPANDFTIYNSANTGNGIETVSPIVGELSYLIELTGGIGAGGNNTVRTTQKGYDKGRLRLLFRWDTGPLGAGYGVTINCMQSVEDIVGGNGDFYQLFIKSTDWELRKITAGNITSIGTTLASDSFTTVNGTVYAAEMEWKGFPSSVTFTVKRGTATDFSDLATVISHVDSSSPFTATVAEGFGFCDKTQSSNFEVVYDELTFHRVLV